MEELDLSRLKVKPPICRGQKICKEDLNYLMFELLLTSKEIGQIYNRSDGYVQKLCKFYNIPLTREHVKKAMEAHSLRKYGVRNPAQLKEVREKYKKTCLERYGSTNYFASDEGKQKIIESNIEKYGVSHNHQNQEVIDKMKKTFLEKYGNECSLNNKEVREKAKKTLIKHYGVDNGTKSPIIRKKMEQTNIERFGVPYAAQNEEIKQKEYNTKKKNGTFTTSKPEDEIYQILNEKFEVIRQHKCELYPYRCDFYLPKLDLYIEYNGHWSHGGYPFVEKDEQYYEWVEKSKTSQFYTDALHCWTIRDVEKLNTFKKNNLNFKIFYNFKEFENWFINFCK